jgi:hypothetical protein
VGVNTFTAPVKAPGFHVYDVAPLAVKVVFCPEQTTLFPLILTVGFAITDTVFVVGEELPKPFDATSVIE